MPAAAHQFAAVVEGIHATSLGHRGWTQTISDVVDFVGGLCGDINFFDPAQQRVVRLESARIDTNALQKYLAEVQPDIMLRNPRMSIYLGMDEGDMRADSESWSRKERDRHPFFADVMYRGDMYDCLNAYVRKNDTGSAWVAMPIHFARKHGPPTGEHRRRLRMVLPHIRRAIATEERLGQAQRETGALAAALDRVKQAVALVDGAGRVVRANEPALALLRASDGLVLAADGRLLFAAGAARDAFARALAPCSRPFEPLNLSTPLAQVAVSRAGARPLVLTLQPLPHDLAGAFRAAAVLFISDPDAKGGDRRGALREAYGLSPMEARLVQALGEGQSLRNFAQAGSMAYETVRSHLRRVFMKTGTRRQADLMRLMQAFR